MSGISDSIGKLIKGRGEFAYVFRGSFVALFVRVLAAGATFLLNIVIARVFSAHGTGLYYTALLVLMAGSLVGRFGLDATALRLAAPAAAKKDWPRVRAIHRNIAQLVLALSVPVTVAVYLSTPFFAEQVFGLESLIRPIRIMSLGILPFSLLLFYSELLRSVGEIRDSQIVGFVIVPFGAIFLIGSGIVILGTAPIELPFAAHFLASSVAAFAGWIIWRRYIGARDPEGGDLTAGKIGGDELWPIAYPFFGIYTVNFVSNWAAVAMLGVMESPEQVGIFAVAMRTALLTGFALQAVGTVTAPQYAILYENGDIAKLEKLGRKSTHMMLAMAAPLMLVLLIFPDFVMGLFGPEFKEGATVLVILCVGQIVHAATGNVGHVLMMTGHEKQARNNNLLGMLVNLSIALVLIPSYGIVGAAFAYSAGVAVQKLVAFYKVRKLLGITLI